MEEPTTTFSTTQGDAGTLPLRQQYWFKILICVLYSVIFALGVLGNTAVIFIIYRRKKLKTVTNLFILNLAISDLIFSGSIPLEFPLILEDYDWPYASFFCKIYSPVQTIAVSVSIFTLAAVSCIRYRAIVIPLRRQVSRGAAKYILIGVWTFASILMMPHFLTLKMKGETCDEKWPDVVYRKTYTTILFCFFYLIPLVIITFAYGKIVKELKKKTNYHNAALDELRAEETSKVVHMLIRITVVFAACNLPSQVMWLWLDFGRAEEKFEFFWDLLTALNIFIFANSAANPFIYYMYHDKFRSEARGCLRRVQRSLRSIKLSTNVSNRDQFHRVEQLCPEHAQIGTKEIDKSIQRKSTSSGFSIRLISLGTNETQEDVEKTEL